MTKQQQVFWALVIVVVIIGVFWWVSAQGKAPVPQIANSQTSEPMLPATSSSSGFPTNATVTFNGAAFSPASVTIAQGGTVIWTSTGGDMWVASDPYPLHNGYDGTSQEQHCAPGYTGAAPFDECSAGTSFSFIFNKVGTWGYQDHINDAVGGSVTVVAQ